MSAQKKLTVALATIAEVFENLEKRTDKNGEEYDFNRMYFSQKQVLDNIFYAADRRMEWLYTPQTKNRYGMVEVNKYSIHYLGKVLAEATERLDGGEISMQIYERADEALEAAVLEYQTLNAFRDQVADFIDAKYGIKLVRKDWTKVQEAKPTSEAMEKAKSETARKLAAAGVR